MLRRMSTMLPLAALLFVFAAPGDATLAGTSVNGSLTFRGDTSNYFDPLYGFVPTAGYLNISGTTVTVSDSAVEFGFNDGVSLISADFTGNQLMVSDRIETSGTNNSFQMSFMDPAFAGNYLLSVSDNFPLFPHSLTGNVVTLGYAGGNLPMGETLTAKFEVVPVPEPSSAGLLMLAFLTFAFFIGKLRVRSA